MPHPAQDIKQERKTNTKDEINYKTSKAESPEVSSLPAGDLKTQVTNVDACMDQYTIH